MDKSRKIETVIILEAVNVDNLQVIEAGEYRCEMPEDYDPALVTAADIVHDGQIAIVE